ncbi:molybdopterin-dependent oxidoreductase [Chloroflexota bacterium]
MKEDQAEIRKGSCPVCTHGCHVKVHIHDGEVTRVTADTGSPKGKLLCQNAVAAVDIHYHPERLNYPLKRTGGRGEGKWERISWEKAIDEIARKLDKIKTSFGPESVTVLGGGNTNSSDPVAWKWCNLWGTPNIFAQGKNCSEAELLAECAIYGYGTLGTRPVPGITKCAILWGRNPWASGENRDWPVFLETKKAGAKLVVIDPRFTDSAQKADIWVQLRPGTDGALALGMLNVIIKEQLYDKEFVNNWCLGFDELAILAQKYPLDKVEDITWVPQEQIANVARLYATSKPAYVSSGVALGQLGRGASISAVVGKCLLRAITGNLEVEGGNPLTANPEISAYLEEVYWDKLIAHPLRKRDNVSAHVWPIASVRSLELFREAQSKVYPRGVGISQYFLFPASHYLWSAILEEDPYPIKAVFLAKSNPLVVLGNGRRIYNALMSPNLDLLVAIERWMTPSARLADYVLPSADNLERPDLDNMWGFTGSHFAREQAVEPLYERRDDYYLWRGLGIRLGQAGNWPETLEQWFDKILAPAKVTFKELATRDIPGITLDRENKAYEQKGFATFSGKVELTSSYFERLGYPSLPDYQEPPWSPVSRPDLAKEYPLILISGGRVRPYRHSQHRQIEKLRRRYPYPLLQLHPETAQKLGINDGDPVYIETPVGKIKQKAQLTPGIHPRVVHADGYWWYPELPGEEPSLFGVWDSNINSILPDDPELCDYAGDNPFRGLLCRVYKA